VKDTGIGIPEDVQKQLFRPFFQAGAGTAHVFGGTGLGLVICERLVTMMGGAIGVASEPGTGTTMKVSISAAVADPKSLPRKGGAPRLAPAHRVAPSPAIAEAEGTLLLLADGEGARHTHEVTLDRLSREDATREDVLAQFATLTLGSGAAAMVLGRSDSHSEGHRLIGGVMRAETEHHELCIGDLESMRTDAKGLLDAGMALSRAIWEDAKAEFDWSNMDRYIAHQVSQTHTAAMCRTVDIDPSRVPLTFPTRGNMGPATIPFTLATQLDSLRPGHRVLLMGAGSGMNAACVEVVW
jgi:hypothetical protein